MIHNHQEIEAKLNADSVSVQQFNAFMASLNNIKIERFECIKGPDRYYEQGTHVLRHRIESNTKHELTVKRRRSETNTRDREEIDLSFSKKTEPCDVDALLLAVGFTHAFTIVKEAHIYWVKLTPNLNATFVIYDVWLEGEPEKSRRYLEIEAEKKSDVTVDTAKRHIRTWIKVLQEKLGVGEPINESLYEIYSGKRNNSIS